MSGFRFETYRWCGGEEWMVARGPIDGRHLLILPPLFEEMNFTRATLAEMGRRLADRGIATWLPDLPGTGESLARLETLGWRDWRDAVAAAATALAERTGAPLPICAIRGGTLLDDAAPAPARWRYSPATGESLLRQMRRTQILSESPNEAGGDPGLHLAGYDLSPAMAQGLAAAVPLDLPHRAAPARAGIQPWRRAEPACDVELAHYLADDICDWIETCASR